MTKQRVESIFAFCLVDDDGDEGIVCVESLGGPQPLIGADVARVDSLRPIAQELATQWRKPITVRYFEHGRDVEIIEPMPTPRRKRES